MNANLRFQLNQLDRALLGLVEERARLAAQFDGPAPRAAVDDLLRRHDGALAPHAVRALFASVDSACDACRNDVETRP